MTIIRREHRAHFTVLPNAIFVDQRLSIEAKDVLGYLLSRPNKWSRGALLRHHFTPCPGTV